MNIKYFPNIEDAIWSFAANHRCHYLYPHKLAAGEKAEQHYHRKANEWLIISKGEFKFSAGFDLVTFDLDGRSAIAIKIPVGEKHSLIALSGIKYFVIRDKKDRNVYCSD